MVQYNPQKIEKKWQRFWRLSKLYEPNLKKSRRPFYNLMMFPYPSAEGLHVGNMYAFTGSDIYGRLKRMQGYDVFEPIGLDGFGIHSENYALQIGRHPMRQAKISEKRFYKQLEIVGNGFAWDEKLETYDPEYYKWTQWIFVQMFKRGLAYRKKAPVNWCVSCKTVLADEQVIGGKCERCDAQVVKKELEQWFFKITKYAERLLKNLDKIDWSERIKVAQRNWIGRSEGALIKFNVRCQMSSVKCPQIEVFTTRPDTLFGATYMVLAPEHPFVAVLLKSKNQKSKTENYEELKDYIERVQKRTPEERIKEGREKTGVELKGVKAINPANGEEIPIWVADYVLGDVGTGAIMAVPAHDQRDLEFARKYGLPIRKVIEPKVTLEIQKSKFETNETAYEDAGVLVNSGKFSGMSSEKAKWEITKFVGGKRKVLYRLRDWLISRQRYWGPPIPMIYCPTCAKASAGKENAGWQPVSEKDLPVKLPYIKDFRPTGTEKAPLATVEKFYKVRCPRCKSWAKRETDVSDTFLDSAWYYIGFLAKTANSKFEIQNSKFRQRARRWLPVDMYIGGAEHAVLHLLYVRFLAMVFYDWGLIHFEEPFKKFRAHGLLIKDGAKMSKSRGNVINPDEYIKKFGADALRIYLMFLGPFEQGGDFRDTGIRGITRFLERVWKFTGSYAAKNSKLKILNPKQIQNQKSKIQKVLHKTIRKVTEDIENLQYNTAISALMVLLNELEKNPEVVTKEDVKIFLKLLAPFAPHITEELWQQIKGQRSKIKSQKFESIHRQPWPKYDPKLLREERYNLIIQVNGRVRDKIEVASDISEQEVSKMALSQERIKRWVSGKAPKKIVFVPGRLINFVV